MTLATAVLFSSQFNQPGLCAAGVDELPRRGALGASFSPLSPDEAKSASLNEGEGIKIVTAVPGLTADKAGLKPGDIILAINGKPQKQQTVGLFVRDIKANSTMKFSIMRDGKKMEVSGPLVEKPRDPGNNNYKVEYRHIVSNGLKMRTIVTIPTKPGKHPGFFFIQGFSPISYDYKLEGSKGDVTTMDGPILFEAANSNYVTIRVEKPGVGDSEGSNFAELDYTTELDIYRQTLKQLKEMPGVDANNIFIFGHSMGGAFGPMIASENPVKGIAVYGTAARTWHEYINDTVRYQSILAGDSYENVDETVRQVDQIMALVMHEGKSVAEVKKMHPELAPMADAFLPGGMFNGKTVKFWAQLAKTNFPAYWAKCNARVLSARGTSDFVTYDADHTLIADVVNKVHPGWGKFVAIPSTDHLFHNFATEADSLKNFQKGTFNPAFIKVLMDWMADVYKQ